jgi:hypothetical protein
MTHLIEIHQNNQIAAGNCVPSEQSLKDILPQLTSSFEQYLLDEGIEGEISWEKELKFENCSIRPDGGLFYIKCVKGTFCFLVVEDKYQGTNDKRYTEGKKKQSTGNAIERAFKNLNASWHLFKDLHISPYVVFVAGCDFHHSESIIHRIGPVSNFGRNPIIREALPDGTFDMNGFCEKINIIKDQNREFGIFCVKAHKYDEHQNRTSMWSSTERLHVLEYTGKKAIKEINRHLNSYE